MTTNKGHILIVDDEKDIRFLLNEILTDEGYTITEAPHSEAAFAAIAKTIPDLVILDIWLENSDRDGMEILAEIKKTSRAVPVLMISGHGNIEMAVKAVKLGAYDFIEKPFNTDRLLHLVGRAIESARLKRSGISSSIQLVAGTAEMLSIQRAGQKAAHNDARVLITGAWGTGRAHLARWIHQESSRASAPFVDIRCANASADTITHALTNAGAGTLLLRDVQKLPSDARNTLLSKLSGKTDVRIMTTASPDAKSVLPGDLYDRLAITAITVPTLEDRRADIADLVLAFLGEGASIAEETIAALKRRDWPGQVAELKALCTMASVRMMLDQSTEMTMAHIESGTPMPAETISADSREWLETDLRTAREAFERWYFEHLMERFDGNVSQVAAFAGMDRTALHRKLKSLKETDDSERLAS